MVPSLSISDIVLQAGRFLSPPRMHWHDGTMISQLNQAALAAVFFGPRVSRRGLGCDRIVFCRLALPRRNILPNHGQKCEVDMHLLFYSHRPLLAFIF